jgi:hypothetical protein
MAFDFPALPTEGQSFIPPSGPAYTFRNGAWMAEVIASGSVVYVGDTPPAAPVPGQLWWESDTGNTFIWYVDGSSSQWVQTNINASVLAGYLPLAGGTLTGNVAISKADPSLLLNKTAAGQGNWFGGLVNSVTRWIVQLGDVTAEDGSNKGSNFAIDRYSDAGAFLGTALKIDRDTGHVTVASGSNGVLFTDTVGISGNSGLWMKSLGLIRWSIYKGGPAETGSGNVGSDLHIFRNNDAGVAIDSVLSIARSTAAVVGSSLATAAEYMANSINKIATVNNLWSAAFPTAIPYAASVTLNLNNLVNCVISQVTGPITLPNPTGNKAGQTGAIRLNGDLTPRAITFGTNWWFPTGNKPTATSGGHDMIFYHCVDGATLLCSYVKGYSNA